MEKLYKDNWPDWFGRVLDEADKNLSWYFIHELPNEAQEDELATLEQWRAEGDSLQILVTRFAKWVADLKSKGISS